jgi:hypothetical protein
MGHPWVTGFTFFELMHGRATVAWQRLASRPMRWPGIIIPFLRVVTPFLPVITPFLRVITTVGVHDCSCAPLLLGCTP